MTKTLIFSLLLNVAFLAFEGYQYFRVDDSKVLMDKVAQNKKFVAEEERLVKEKKGEIEAIRTRDYLIEFRRDEGVLLWQRK